MKLQETIPETQLETLNNKENIYYSKDNKIYVTPEQIPQLLKFLHDEHLHPGERRLLRMTCPYFKSPDLRKAINEYVKTCHICQLYKKDNHQIIGKTQLMRVPQKPYELMSTDTIVMGKSAGNNRNKYIQVIIDHHTRFLWTYATAKNNEATIIKIFEDLIEKGHKPEVLLTDQFTTYRSHGFNKFLKENGIHHRYSITYHPQSNGKTERVNATIKSGLRLLIQQNPTRSWVRLLAEVTHMYNNTPHSVTNFTPAFLLQGTNLHPVEEKFPVKEARTIANQRTEQHNQHNKKYRDRKLKDYHFKLGDIVKYQLSVRTEGLKQPFFTGRYKVINVVNPVTLVIQEQNDVDAPKRTVHTSQVQLYHHREVNMTKKARDLRLVIRDHLKQKQQL